MEMYYQGSKLWVRGSGTKTEVLKFLEDCVNSQGQYDMVDGEIMGDIETYERD